MRKLTLIKALSIIGCVLMLPFCGQIVKAQGVDYNLNYSDPASDVTWVYGNGTSEMMSEPKDINIKWVRSEMQADNQTIKLTIELTSPGTIRTDNATIYQINVYTSSDNSSHFTVKYNNGECKLGSNITDATNNDSVEYSISGLTLDMFVNSSELGNVTSFNIDASAETREYENATVGWILKKDFGWELPGSPGSTPEGTDDTPGFEIWTIALAVVIAVAMINANRKRK